MFFQRLYQQPFGILGRNAFISDRHIGHRDIDIRGRFLGNVQIGDVTETTQHQQRNKDRAGAGKGGADHTGHDAGSGETRTGSPAVTKA